MAKHLYPGDKIRIWTEQEDKKFVCLMKIKGGPHNPIKETFTLLSSSDYRKNIDLGCDIEIIVNEAELNGEAFIAG